MDRLRPRQRQSPRPQRCTRLPQQPRTSWCRGVGCHHWLVAYREGRRHHSTTVLQSLSLPLSPAPHRPPPSIRSRATTGSLPEPRPGSWEQHGLSSGWSRGKAYDLSLRVHVRLVQSPPDKGTLQMRLSAYPEVGFTHSITGRGHYAVVYFNDALQPGVVRCDDERGFIDVYDARDRRSIHRLFGKVRIEMKNYLPTHATPTTAADGYVHPVR